jgi:sugar phosphate isomerase/epimerase
MTAGPNPPAPHPRLSVNSSCTRGWPLERDLRFWRSHGYQQVGLVSYKLDDAQAADAVGQAGLTVSNVAIAQPFTLGQSENWPAQQERIGALLRQARALGAGCVYMNSGSSASRMTVDDSIAAFCAAVAPVAELARTLGVRLALEPSAQANHDRGCVHSLRDALSIADQTGLHVVADLQTCWLERGLAAMVGEHLDQVALVQVSDFVVGTEVRLSRSVPGDGDIPLSRIIGDLLQAGYPGAFDLEILGPRIEEEGYDSAVPRGAKWLSDCLTALGA